MIKKYPKINVDILVIRENKVLLGLLTKDWNYKGKQVYGVPGSDIRFGEKMGTTIKRDTTRHTGCRIIKYKIFSVNANYALGNHYIGIGVLAEINGEPRITDLKEWEKWEWFELDKIPKNLFPATKNLINSYVRKKFVVSE